MKVQDGYEQNYWRRVDISNLGVPIQHEQKDSPESLSPKVSAMQYELHVIRDVESGWPTMQGYLHQFDGESNAAFAARAAIPCWTDVLNPVVDGAIGKMFRVAPELVANERVLELWDDIDNAGTNGFVFIERVARDAAIAGQSFIYVDYPPVEGNPTRGQRQSAGVRPYFVNIPLDNVTNFDYEVRGGRTLLTLFVWREVVYEREGFKQNAIVQYRVLRQSEGVVTYEVWRKGANEKIVLYQEPEVIVGVAEIPVISVNFREVGYLESRPLFMELGYSCLDYYLVTSDMRHAHHMTSYPTLVVTGVDPTELSKVRVGANAALALPDPNAKAEYKAGDGKGVELGLEIRKAIRSEMGLMGLAFVEDEQTMAQETARAKSIDASIDDAFVNSLSQEIETSVNKALQYLTQFEDTEEATLTMSSRLPIEDEVEPVLDDSAGPEDRITPAVTAP